jgi:FkbM family methyltransferase
MTWMSASPRLRRVKQWNWKSLFVAFILGFFLIFKLVTWLFVDEDLALGWMRDQLIVFREKWEWHTDARFHRAVNHPPDMHLLDWISKSDELPLPMRDSSFTLGGKIVKEAVRNENGGRFIFIDLGANIGDTMCEFCMEHPDKERSTKFLDAKCSHASLMAHPVDYQELGIKVEYTDRFPEGGKVKRSGSKWTTQKPPPFGQWIKFAFECNPRLIPYLASQQGVDEHDFTLYNSCVFSANGVARFNWDPNNNPDFFSWGSNLFDAFTVDRDDPDHSRLAKWKKVESGVNVTNFSQWLKATTKPEDHVVVKLDVEGAEFSIIPQMIREGTICLVDVLSLEEHRWGRPPGVIRYLPLTRH